MREYRDNEGTVSIGDEHEQFLAERRSGVGGSDMHHVFGLEPYGCELRLWYEKRNAFPDVTQEITGPMKRGVKLEGIIAEDYAERSGRKVLTAGIARHRDFAELMVHVDRDVIDSDHGNDVPGVLECKTVGRELFFRYKQEGLPEGYVLQLQHGMLVTERVWGSFAVLWPDGWQLLWWDVDRDEELCEMIRDEALDFWRKVQNGPAPEGLDPSDPRCPRCPFVDECQGAVMRELMERQGEGTDQDASLAPLVVEYLEAQEREKVAKGDFAAVKAELKDAMGERLLVQVPGAGKVHFKPNREWDTATLEAERPDIATTYKCKWDLTALGKDHPELEQGYKRFGKTRPLRVYPLKKRYR